MTVWILTALLWGGATIEFDVFYTQERCEHFAAFIRSQGDVAKCRPVVIKE